MRPRSTLMQLIICQYTTALIGASCLWFGFKEPTWAFAVMAAIMLYFANIYRKISVIEPTLNRRFDGADRRYPKGYAYLLLTTLAKLIAMSVTVVIVYFTVDRSIFFNCAFVVYVATMTQIGTVYFKIVHDEDLDETEAAPA